MDPTSISGAAKVSTDIFPPRHSDARYHRNRAEERRDQQPDFDAPVSWSEFTMPNGRIPQTGFEGCIDSGPDSNDDAPLKVLLDLRQNVQRALDNAFLNGQIRMDSGVSLDEEISGCFAGALRKISSGDRSPCKCFFDGSAMVPHRSHFKATEPPPPIDCWGTDTTSPLPTPTTPGIATNLIHHHHQQQQQHLTTTEMRPCAITDGHMVSPHQDAFVSATTSGRPRRKRMPKIAGAYPCSACEKVFDRAGDRAKHEVVHEPARRAKHFCLQCGKGFTYPKDLRRHSKLHGDGSGSLSSLSVPLTPSTFSPTTMPATGFPGSTDSSMSAEWNLDSYFPPWDEYWTKQVTVALPTALEPLLPTPESAPALPVPDLSLDETMSNEQPVLPTCSCPATDTCVVESLALLVGSIQVLTATTQYHGGDPQLSQWGGNPHTTGCASSIPREVLKLEPTLEKLLLPLLASGAEIDVAEILLRHWRHPVASGGPFTGTDLCGRLRQCLDSMGIDLVDTFAPMQHDLHMLLAREGFDDATLQSKFEALKVQLRHHHRDPHRGEDEESPMAGCDRDEQAFGATGSRVRLLLEANAQLVLFSVKDTMVERGEIRGSLKGRVDDLARRVELWDSGGVFSVGEERRRSEHV